MSGEPKEQAKAPASQTEATEAASNLLSLMETTGADGSGRHPRPPARQKGAVCRCAKSKCLKLYCDCFQQKRLCSVDCECDGCLNTLSHNGPDGVRTRKIAEILQYRPDAFEPRRKKTREGCRCKKSKCLKKYCVCYNASVFCGDFCFCVGCENQLREEEETATDPAGPATPHLPDLPPPLESTV